MRNIFWSLLIVFFLSACGTHQRQYPLPSGPDIASLPATPATPPPEGSLYSGTRAGFFEDHRARRVGDVITVKILENYQSSINVSNKLARSSNVKGGISALFGFEKAVEKHNPNFSAGSMLGGDFSSSVNGQGKLSRDTKILATFSARVVKVLPNGNLVIQGVRVIRQNENIEYLTISGIVRPEDIDADNSVLSTQIADAHVEYSGAGPTALTTRGPGWFTRLLERVWPF